MPTRLLDLLNRFYIPLSYLIIFLINIPVLDNLPFSDDFRFVFGSNHISNAPNPFVYFFPWSIYYKSWALSYAVLWSIYKIFGEQVVFYRLINLTLHFVNHLLFRKILDKKFDLCPHKRNFFSLLFLLHPLSVLTTSWIFQIKTLLAVLFFLLFYLFLNENKIERKRDYLKLYCFFWLSLVSKVCAILFPIYFIWEKRSTLSLKKLSIIAAPLVLISLSYGLLNIKGITHLQEENAYLKNIIAEKSNVSIEAKSDYEKKMDFYDNAVKQPGGVTFDINVYQDITKGVDIYFDPLVSVTGITGKYVIAIQNLARFFLSTLGLNNYFPFYETNLETATNKWLLMLVFLSSLLIIGIIYLKNSFFNIAIVLFIPISGFFYIPYMKFSYSSDHWFYPGMIFLILGMVGFFKKHQKLFVIFFLFIATNYLYTVSKYSSFPKLLKQNLVAYKNPVITDHMTPYLQIAGDWRQIFINYTFLLDNIAFDNHNYGHQVYKAAILLGDGDALTPYYPRMAKAIIKKKDFQLLKTFNLKLSGMIPDKTLDLTESLDAIFSHKLDQHTYQKAIQLLE